MPMTAAHPEPDLLVRYNRGELPPEELQEIEQHVLACDTCCGRLQDLPADSFIERLRTCHAAESGRLLSRDEIDSGQATLPMDEMSSRLPIPAHADALAWTMTVRTDDTALGAVEGRIPTELADHQRYYVKGLCGIGGMGAVYRAEHRLMGRDVALKVINPRMLERPAVVERFQREVKAAARLSHPNIVAAYDAEQIGRLHLLVMEYVDGDNLADRVAASGPLSVSEGCDVIRQAALGLQHAFQQGMVHRDIKPQNLMRTPDGQIKILDFGLATLVADEIEPDLTTDAGASAAETRLTHASTTIGTPDYVAPEQIADARAADIRADIYGLGCTLYFLLTGQPPYPGGSVADKIQAHTERRPRAIRQLRDDVPKALADVVERMMARDPGQRYQTPAEVAEALRPFAIDADAAGVRMTAFPQPPPSPPRRLGDVDLDRVWWRGLMLLCLLGIAWSGWATSGVLLERTHNLISDWTWEDSVMAWTVTAVVVGFLTALFARLAHSGWGQVFAASIVGSGGLALAGAADGDGPALVTMWACCAATPAIAVETMVRQNAGASRPLGANHLVWLSLLASAVVVVRLAVLGPSPGLVALSVLLAAIALFRWSPGWTPWFSLVAFPVFAAPFAAPLDQPLHTTTHPWLPAAISAAWLVVTIVVAGSGQARRQFPVANPSADRSVARPALAALTILVATLVGGSSVSLIAKATASVRSDPSRTRPQWSDDVTHDAGVVQGELTTEAAKALLPAAAGITNQDWAVIASRASAPTLDSVESKSLSLVLLSLRPAEAAQANPDAPQDFRFRTEDPAKRPSAIAEALRKSRDKGYVTFLQPEFLTEVTASVEGETARGEAAFKAPDLYEGRVQYVARNSIDGWRIEEFHLPNYGISLVRGDDGVWKQKEATDTPGAEPLPTAAEDVIRGIEKFLDALNKGEARPGDAFPLPSQDFYDKLDALSQFTKGAEKGPTVVDARTLMMRITGRLAGKLKDSPEAKRRLRNILLDFKVTLPDGMTEDESLIWGYIKLLHDLRSEPPEGNAAGDDAAQHGAAGLKLGLDGTYALLSRENGATKLVLPKQPARLKRLRISDVPISDSDLARLSVCTNLEELALSEAEIHGSGLAHLADLQNLRDLQLIQCPLWEKELHTLQSLTQLTELELSATSLRDSAMVHLEPLKNLRDLSLRWTEVGDKGLAILARLDLQQLERLDLLDCPATDAGLAELARLDSLRELNLSQTKITGAGLEALSRLPKLEKLYLNMTDVNDAGLKYLELDASLKWVMVSDTKVTEAGIERLKEARPDLTVFHWSHREELSPEQMLRNAPDGNAQPGPLTTVNSSFTVVVPAAPIVIQRGDAKRVTISIDRDNFDGSLQLQARGLPDGLRVDPVGLEGDKTEAELVIKAETDAESGDHRFMLRAEPETGRSVDVGLTVRVEAERRESSRPSPRQIIDRAIAAHGGRKALDALLTVRRTWKGEIDPYVGKEGYAGNLRPAEWVEVWRMPDQVYRRVEATLGENVAMQIDVLNGEQAWQHQQTPRWYGTSLTTRELDDRATAELREQFHALDLVRLAAIDDDTRLAAVEEIVIDGRPAAGVLIKDSRSPALKLYFDRQTWLLAKKEQQDMLLESKIELYQEVFYSDYFEHEGLQHPRSVLSKHDGQVSGRAEMLRLEFSPRIDESLFANPRRELQFREPEIAPPEQFTRIAAQMPHLTRLDLSGTGPVSGQHLAAIARIQTLEELDLESCQVDGQSLHDLAPLKNLRTLNLTRNRIAGPMLDQLVPLRNLRSLDLDENNLGSGSLAALAEIPNLQVLDLNNCGLTDGAFEELSGASLNSLESLDLSKNPIGDAAIVALPELPALTRLLVAYTQVTPEGLQKLEAPNLEQLGITLDQRQKDDAWLESIGRFPAYSSWLRLNDSAVTDAGLTAIGHLMRPTHLQLRNTDVSDAGAAHLGGMRGLTNLDLTGTAVSDEGLRSLRPLVNLETLALSQTQVTGIAFEDLAVLNMLSELAVIDCPLTVAGVAAIAQLDGLKSLSLSSSARNLSADDLRRLAALPQLEHLNLERAAFTEDALAGLAGCSSLQRLSLSGSNITGAHLRHLPPLAGLKSVDIARTGVGDDEIVLLKPLPGLETVSLRESRVTDQGFEQLNDSRSGEIQSIPGSDHSDRVTTPHPAERDAVRALWRMGFEVALDDDSRRATMVHLGAPLHKYETFPSRWPRRALTAEQLRPVATLPHVRKLNLTVHRLSPEAWKLLGSLQQLEEIWLHFSPTTDDDLQHLAALENLKVLRLDQTEVRGPGLAALRHLLQLQQLELDDCAVDDAGLADLPELPNLQRLDLTGTRITSAGLENMPSLPSLKRLLLQRTQVDDAAVEALSRRTSLEGLYLQDTNITRHGLQTLRASLPDCNLKP